MRRILPIIALFSLCGATAQEYIPSYGLERPRSEIRIYPTAEEACLLYTSPSPRDTR